VNIAYATAEEDAAWTSPTTALAFEKSYATGRREAVVVGARRAREEGADPQLLAGFGHSQTRGSLASWPPVASRPIATSLRVANEGSASQSLKVETCRAATW